MTTTPNLGRVLSRLGDLEDQLLAMVNTTAELREAFVQALREDKAVRICARCGKPLPAGARSDARYCAVACRVAAGRDRKRREALR